MIDRFTLKVIESHVIRPAVDLRNRFRISYAMPLKGDHSHGKADVNITISLSEKGDLLRFQSGDVDQRIDHFLPSLQRSLRGS